ncbi:MAG: hypothetical protein RLZZ336_1645 [Cyanobacteriota bacterium]
MPGVVVSLLLALLPLHQPLPLRAASVLELQLDGLALPIDLKQLQEWSLAPEQTRGELASWLSLLDGRSRRDLVQLLRAPLLRDRSFGQQLLASWTGEQLLQELAGLLNTGERGADARARSAELLRRTVSELLSRRGEFNSLDLLLALPPKRVSLQLDGVLELAQQWRDQLLLQRQALRQLPSLGLPERRSTPLVLSQQSGRGNGLPLRLAVAHRPGGLPLELWPAQGRPQGTWVVLMPGLGGSAGQLSWLAAALSRWGWPVVVLDHPGSDASALQASLVGRQPPPDAESLRERLADVDAVLQAQRQGRLGRLGARAGAPAVLIGHSLGGLTALLAAGQQPEPGLGRRCRQALSRLPLTNLSRLLQCQVPRLGPGAASGSPIAAVVAYNGFGSLLWPQGLQGLRQPVLLVGGSLDLITPPLSEQLAVFGQQRQGRSRLVVVEGGSHFSPVRVGSGEQALFQLGDDLVGVDPRKVQALLLQLTAEFLQSLEQPLLLSPQIRELDGVRAHVLDGPLARRWSGRIRTPAVDPARPAAHRPPR